MKTRRVLDEMTHYLRDVLEYVGSTEFDTERRLAREEFFGHSGPQFEDERRLMDECAAYYGWFMFDRPVSSRETTPVRLYVEHHPDLPSRVRANLLACEESLYSTFEVVEVQPEQVIVLNLLGEATDYYKVAAEEFRLQPGDLISARLVRWDEVYYFHGEVVPWPQTTRDVAPLLRAQSRERRGRMVPLTKHAEATDPPVSRRGWLRDRRARP